MDNIKKIKRFSKIVNVFSKYGIEEIISRGNSMVNSNFNGLGFKERLRLALEELGPTYIKFGQLLSNRKDLIPEDLADELKKLQDNVQVENIDIIQKLINEFGINPEEHFVSIDSKPFASASISQVYKAVLLSGEEVILKVKRSNIESVVESDLALIRDIVHLLEKKYNKLQKIFISEILKSFENSITSELSLTNELLNIERFRKNFDNSDELYVPKTYVDYCNNNILCMEYINGCKINDKEKLDTLKIDPKIIVKKGLDIYLKQILNDGFFHADPHPGNILILKNGQIVFIDFGSMGVISINEKVDLENMVINFGLKNPKQIVRSLKRMAIKHYIENEKLLENNISDILTYLENNTINDLNIQVLIKKFNKILQNNHILLPEYVYILLRGITLIEGVGKELNADLNIQQAMVPYAIKLSKEKLYPKNLTNKIMNNVKDIHDLLNDLPEETEKLIDKINNDKLTFNFKISEVESIKRIVKDSVNKIVLAILTLTFGLGASIVAKTNIEPSFFNIPLFSWLGYFMSTFTTICIFFLMLKKK